MTRECLNLILLIFIIVQHHATFTPYKANEFFLVRGVNRQARMGFMYFVLLLVLVVFSFINIKSSNWLRRLTGLHQSRQRLRRSWCVQCNPYLPLLLLLIGAFVTAWHFCRLCDDNSEKCIIDNCVHWTCVHLCSDKLFPALGFGAKLPPQGQVSHEFFLVSLLFS